MQGVGFVVKRDLVSVKRDLVSVKRDLSGFGGVQLCRKSASLEATVSCIGTPQVGGLCKSVTRQKVGIQLYSIIGGLYSKHTRAMTSQKFSSALRRDTNGE